MVKVFHALVLCLLFAGMAAAAEQELCCFLNPLISFLRPFLNVFGIATTTTTTTSTTTTSSSTSTSTTRTTTTSTETSTTYYTTSTTSTTLGPNNCNSYLDCPPTETVVRCRGLDKNIVTQETTVYSCFKPWTPESRCKGNVNSHIVTTCPKNYLCVDGNMTCAKI